MRKRKEDGEAREKNLEEQLAVETSANQELQVRFFVGRMRHNTKTSCGVCT